MRSCYALIADVTDLARFDARIAAAQEKRQRANGLLAQSHRAARPVAHGDFRGGEGGMMS